GAVVAAARRAALEEGGHDHHAELARDACQHLARRTRNGLGEVEERRVFALTEVGRPEELREADDPRTPRDGLANARDGRVEVGRGIGAHAHLHEADREARGRSHRRRHCPARGGLSTRAPPRSAGIAGAGRSRMPRMDMSYTPEEEAFRARVRAWLEANVP